MKSVRMTRGLVALASLSLVAAACGSDDTDTAATTAPTVAETTAPAESTPGSTGGSGTATTPSSEICDTDALVAAVEGGTAEGTLSGMADDPVATAASNNPVLTTLVAAVTAAGLGDTLNSAEALTVFAPTDCAFANLDPATMDAAMADPTGLLATVLGFHVLPERLSSEELVANTEYETFTGETLQISEDGDTISVGGGQASVLVPDIQTANATVFLIDTVMIPPSVSGAATDDTMTDDTMTDDTMTDSTMSGGASGSGAVDDSSEICDADAIVAAVEGGTEEGTLSGMADDPVATAASSNPVLTTLTAAVGAAGLGDTLNNAEALTVFAPTDCAFANLDPATMDAAMADPTGLLATVLGYHVVGERMSAADLEGMTELESFTGEVLPVSVEGDTITVGDQAMVIVGDIETANATVFLIDTVMMPPSISAG